MRRHPVMLPHDEPPPPWRSWRTRYGKRLEQAFVSDWKPETREAIEEAFENPFPHADAVSALQNVALELDPRMVHLADQFAAKLMNAKWKECKPKCRCKKCRQARLNVELVKADVDTARETTSPCWLGYRIDTRGRVYATQHLNFQREDHVRAMFRFANGQPLGEDGLYWLGIHVANTAGQDKVSFDRRLEWVDENLETIIRKVANDPAGTFNIWGAKEIDRPFGFVAACIEFCAALDNPQHFITHLPIAFDGKCNGVQHSSLVTRDLKSGRRVNLIPTQEPADLYDQVADRTRKAVLDATGWEAAFWREVGVTRKRVKVAAMTLQYGSSTAPWLRTFRRSSRMKRSCAFRRARSA